MPRDLSQEAAAATMKEDSIQGSMPPLTKSPEDMDPKMGVMTADDEDAMINALSERNEKRDELHPYTQTLNMSDVEACVRLEAETFPEHERATREKVSLTFSQLYLLFALSQATKSTIPKCPL